MNLIDQEVIALIACLLEDSEKPGTQRAGTKATATGLSVDGEAFLKLWFRLGREERKVQYFGDWQH